ncbi:MAG TPA: serine hydrolase, partial [Cyclobacteriaceae bacterium]|nr:serine hydrolase [Cyclobacteriaceae bacterium]
QEARKERSDTEAPNTQIGLGWHIRDHKYFWHNGGTGGFRSFAGFDPDKKRAIVILTNSTVGADDLGFHWLDESIPLKAIKMPLRLDPAAIRELEGVYQINPTYKITVTSRDARLFLQATSQPVVSIYAEAPDEFYFKVTDAKVVFKRAANNKIEKLVLFQNGTEREGKKVK